MIPEISENPTFLRYHQILQANPSSIVFAPLAEILILHQCYEEAITVCKKGLERNPDLVSGRIALARAYLGVANYKRSLEEAKAVLNQYQNHPEAIEIIKISEKHLRPAEPEALPKIIKQTVEPDRLIPSRLNPEEDVRWYTPTMAEIYASQGNIDMARKIYKGLLDKDPTNARAREGLEKLVFGRGESGSS